MPVTVIIRKRSIEDHYDAPCAVALSPEAAHQWVERVVDRARRVRNARNVGQMAVKAWETANPDPFTEPEPPKRTPFPHGVDQRHPAYLVYRDIRDQENAVIHAYQDRREAARKARQLCTEAVWAEAVDALHLPPKEVADARRLGYDEPTSADDFCFETWATAEEGILSED